MPRRFRQDRRRQSGRHEFLVLDRLSQAVPGLVDLRPARQLLQILRVGRRVDFVGKIIEDCRALDVSYQQVVHPVRTGDAGVVMPQISKEDRRTLFLTGKLEP